MKLPVTAFLMMAASAAAFAPSVRHQQRAFVPSPLRLSDEKGGDLVPIKEETVEFTAGILGATSGFLIGGPLGAFILGAAANYASKTESEVADVVQAVSKSGIQIYNYLTTLDRKYELLNKAKTSLEGALDKLKAQGSVDPDAVEKVESALATTKSKITEINNEYDLVGGATTALGILGDLVEKAVSKASELNEEYQLSDKALAALKQSVGKATEAAKTASSSAVSAESE